MEKTAGARFDRREHNQIRSLMCERGIINRADGSARFCQGDTAVLVGVHGPARPKMVRSEKLDRAVVEIDFKPNKGVAGSAEAEMALIIRETLEPLIVLSAHPRTVIQLVVQVLNDDGSLLSASILACCMALMDAGVPMTGLPLAVTCALREDASILIDPSAEEEETAESLTTMAFHSTKLDDGLLTCVTTGLLSEEVLFACGEVSRRAAACVLAFVRTSEARRANQIMELSNQS